MASGILTTWERVALKSGADLIETPDGKWKWKFVTVESAGHASSVDAARSFLRYHRTGEIIVMPAATPIAQEAEETMRGTIELKPQTIRGVPMQMRRASLRSALQLAADQFDTLDKQTPELRGAFKAQAIEIRGWLVAEEFAEIIVLKD